MGFDVPVVLAFELATVLAVKLLAVELPAVTFSDDCGEVVAVEWLILALAESEDLADGGSMGANDGNVLAPMVPVGIYASLMEELRLKLTKYSIRQTRRLTRRSVVGSPLDFSSITFDSELGRLPCPGNK